MKSIIKRLKSKTGQSMAEFAVTTAMMATLATTAAPKFSGVGEGAKGKKSEAEIDKIMKAASNFYSAKVTDEGRGRFPGQLKYNEQVGGYNVATNVGGESEVDADIDVWKYITEPAYMNTTVGVKWRSVFGWSNATNGQTHPSVTGGPSDSPITGTIQVDGVNVDCCDGDAEWLAEFGSQPIKSPFQDGHYIYVVVKGGGAGNAATSPIIYVADIESPADYFKKYQP